MYIASKFRGGIKYRSAAYPTREEAAAAFFAEYPNMKSCSTSDAYARDCRDCNTGQTVRVWLDRNTNILFHDRPYQD